MEAARGDDRRDRTEGVDRGAQRVVERNGGVYEQPSALQANDGHAGPGLESKEAERALFEPHVVGEAL